MKTVLIFSLTFILSIICYSQEESIHTIISSGNTLSNDEIYINWVVGENIIDDEVLFDINTGEESVLASEKEDFYLWPTIASTLVNVGTELTTQNDLSIEIYDLSQRLLKTLKWESNPQEINIEAFTPGFYLFRINQKDYGTLAVFKIVKK